MTIFPKGASRIWFPLLLWAVFCTIYYFCFFAQAHVDLKIQVTQPTWFKIYWAKSGQLFSEKHMACVRVKPGRSNYNFFLTDLRRISLLRIDPMEYPGKAVVEQILMRQKGLKDINLITQSGLAQLKPLAEIGASSFTGGKLVVTSTGRDPNFLLKPVVQPVSYSLFPVVVRLAGAGVIIFILCQGASHLVSEFRFVPICLAAILSLVVVMAVISRQNAHPDEFVHVAACEYYVDHWLPPAVSDPAIRNSYSPYGSSRLNTNEIFYPFCGKFAEIIKPFYLSHYLSFRLLNVFLLSLILLYTMRVIPARIMALPLLVSPQIWYLYSYCNSDALALTASFFAGCQLVLPESTFHNYLNKSSGLHRLAQAVLLGLGLGVLLLVKKNYWPYIAFLLFVAAIQFIQLPDRKQKTLWLKRVILLMLIGATLVAGKKGADYWMNGPDRAAKITAMQIQLAKPLYNPETPLAKQHSYLNMKGRGVPLKQLVIRDRWFENTFRSAFGEYGYFTISAPERYYDVVRWSGFVLLSFFLGSILVRGGKCNRFIALTMMMVSFALIGASLYHSWTADFQTQGRYLFPIFAMLAILAGQNRAVLSRRWLSLFTVWMFLISFYSFTWIALLDIPRRILGT